MLGKTESKRRRGWQMMRWLVGITYSNEHEFEQTLGISRRQKYGVLQSTGSQRVRHDLVTEQQ